MLVLLNHSSNFAMNEDVFLGCSEISKIVHIKHEQHIQVIRVFCLPGGTC